MLEKIKNLGNLPLVIILVVVIIIAIVLSIFKGQKSEKTNADTYVSDATNQEELQEEDEQDDSLVVEIIDEELPEVEQEQPEQNEEIVDSKYFIRVNYGQNVVTIYTKDSNGEYTVPYKAMVCSTGTATPRSGTYAMPSSGSKSPRGVWGMMIGNVWAQYYTRIKGSILFHSVPYTERNKWSLEYWEYDKLGTAASAGCVRLTVEDAKWIYNNCLAGTKVEFYSDSNPGPLGKPSAQKISDEEEVRGWDPTDPDGTNPWKTYTPKEDEPDIENTNADKDTNKKPSTTTKPTTPTTPSTPQVPNETPDEGEGSGSETTTPPGDNSGTETTPPSEGESSGENQEGSGSTEEETTNPDGEGTTGEGADNPSGEGTTEENPDEGDKTSGENSGEGSQENKEEQPDSNENEQKTQENTLNA